MLMVQFPTLGAYMESEMFSWLYMIQRGHWPRHEFTSSAARTKLPRQGHLLVYVYVKRETAVRAVAHSTKAI